jgi:protein-S-isoprenylcysteine O-methyltransferase Ste14
VTEKASNRNPKKSADWRKLLFTYRSYTPIPFLLVMLVFARPTGTSMIIGFLLALSGESIRFWGVSYAGSETRTTGAVGGTQLVTSGPYAYLRNPLYLGNILLYIGIGVMSNALMPYLPLVALLYFVFQYTGIVSLEEEYLARTFSNWEEYRTHVGRFLPAIRSFKGGNRLEPDFRRALRSERSSLIALSSISLILILLYFFRGAA